MSHSLSSLVLFFQKVDQRRWMENKSLWKTWSWWTLCRGSGWVPWNLYPSVHQCQAGGYAHHGSGGQDHSFWGLTLFSTLKYKIINGLEIHGVSLGSDENAPEPRQPLQRPSVDHGWDTGRWSSVDNAFLCCGIAPARLPEGTASPSQRKDVTAATRGSGVLPTNSNSYRLANHLSTFFHLITALLWTWLHIQS